MKEYVTGAGGFLGRELVKQLPEYEAIPHKKIQLTTLEPFDRFFFLSAYGNMAHHDDDDAIIKANLLDAVHVATRAMKFDFKSFVFVSTSSVKLKYQTLYSRTKRATEEVLLALTEKHNVPFCIVRPYSITGVGEQPEHLIPTLIRSCLDGEEMEFVPSPVHDFIDVEDVVGAIINLSETGVKGIFEIGNGVPYSNQEVREIVQKVTGSRANIKQVGRLRNYDTDEWVCRNFRARDFGWAPRKNLEQSVREMVDDYVGNRKTSN